jgi:hypothetical protein
VRLDDGRSVGFDVKDYAHIDHGYAATVHKSQGVTVDRAHVLASSHMDRHVAYVGLTRHRERVDLHWSEDQVGSRERLTGQHHFPCPRFVGHRSDLDGTLLPPCQHRHRAGRRYPHPSIVEAAGTDLGPPFGPALRKVRGDGCLDPVDRSRARCILDRVDVHQSDHITDERERQPRFPRHFLVLDVKMRRTMLVPRSQLDMQPGPRHPKQLHDLT